MWEAEEVLGRHYPETEAMGRLLVDHALAYGWDETYGGFYREGTATGPPEDMRKEWWVQFEGLNALLLMHEKYGQQTDAYFNAFQKQWQFIKEKQIDREFGGVYDATQMESVFEQWHGTPAQWKTKAFEHIAAAMTGKRSTPSRHDFMHNKIVIADDTVITGSYNLSHSATENAENVLFLHDPDLADQYNAYVDRLGRRYTAAIGS